MKTIKWAAFFAAVLASLSVQAQTYYITDKVLVGVYEEASGESKLLTTLPSGTPLEVIERSGSFAKVRGPDGSSGWIEGSYMIEHKPAQLVVLELTDKQKQADEQLALAQAELRAMQEQVNQLKLAGKNTGQSDEIKSLTKQRKELGVQLDRVRNQLSDEKKKLLNAENTITQLEAQITTLNKPAPAASKETPQPLDADTERLLAKNRELTATLDRIREALALPTAPATGVVENGGVQIKMTWLWISVILLLVVGFVAGMKWLDWRNMQRHGGFRI
jgi:SH3 domain protein